MIAGEILTLTFMSALLILAIFHIFNISGKVVDKFIDRFDKEDKPHE